MFQIPKRRWLTFSIRTLLIAVTIFCVWLGWQVSIVRERKMLLKRVEALGGHYMLIEDETASGVDPGLRRSGDGFQIPYIRRLLGDFTCTVIAFDSSPTLLRRNFVEDLHAIDKAFPEAHILLARVTYRIPQIGPGYNEAVDVR